MDLFARIDFILWWKLNCTRRFEVWAQLIELRNIGIVYAAGLTTVLIVLMVMFLTFCTRFDMTKWTWVISVSFLAFLICWIWFPWFPSEALAFSIMGLAVAILTFYLMLSKSDLSVFLATENSELKILIKGTKMVVGGGSYEYDMDEHLDAAISLHSDIIFIFLYLLEIFAMCD